MIMLALRTDTAVMAFKVSPDGVSARRINPAFPLTMVAKEPPAVVATAKEKTMRELEPHAPDVAPSEEQMQQLPQLQWQLDDEGSAVPQSSSTTTTTTLKQNKKDASPKTKKTQEIVMSRMSFAPPAVQKRHDDLIEELWAQEQVVNKLRYNVSKLTRTLDDTMAAWQKEEEKVAEEKIPLLEKLEKFTQGLFQLQTSEQKDQQQHTALVQNYAATQKVLEQQVTQLQDTIVTTRNQMRTEQNRFERLSQMLEEVEGTLEWETQEFELEQADLVEALDNEKTQLANLTKGFDQESQTWDQECATLRSNIKAQKEAFDKLQLQTIKQGRQDHLQQSMALQRSIEAQELATQVVSKELAAVHSNQSLALTLLQINLTVCEEDYQSLQQQLQEETTAFLKFETELEENLAAATKERESLTAQLQEQQTEWTKEQEVFQQRLVAEQERIDRLQQQLATEQQQRLERREEWNVQQEGHAEQRRRIASRMHGRFAHLRSVLHEKWQSAKHQGRHTKHALTELYELNLDQTQLALTSLQESLDMSRASERAVKLFLQDESTYNMEETKRIIDRGYTNLLERTQEDIDTLQKRERSLEHDLEEQDQAVKQMEGSLRAIARSCWQLTRQRARRARQRVKKVLLRR